mmetsp:Transcript_24759/g.36647  ORF Transcript_24759/g.36647 Transcript_24759/m.36647 type:complete len:125 (+) Transcript_24759:70-444(+)|eukprot:CAMPEP_0194200496 /NCGR_PEP_ID=MMETSP0156-20130528/1078_1 /TAXON_ID=33649 /ORGANISM="Thalassionema nitzschioides, Strain L26-B" /LENGTH=124 /DNA_ID=CAMNT_0038925501 /DNA_START=65 /DNA_END=439 /DNA_ORIENTATION=+
MPPKRKDNNDVVAPSGSVVFVLMLETICHSEDPMDPEIVGVYNSKEAAAASAGGISSPYGDFQGAIGNEMEECYTDNRKNPPDNGVLIQLGDDDYGEGDIARLTIAKFPIQGMEDASSSNKKQK